MVNAPIHGDEGCSLVVAMVNNDINHCCTVYVLPREKIPISGISESKSMCIFNFERYCSTNLSKVVPLHLSTRVTPSSNP